jgi:TetR/AcrR family transcriptional regulator, transcriptional repressor for nem operon
VARYGREHKEATRRRIVESAGRRFKRDGIDGSGIATLMSDAGLTNGAFYAHFASKDDLVATVVADQLRAQGERLRVLPPGEAGIEQFVREYLSVEHRDAVQDGCPSAALLDEIGRAQPATKRAFTGGLLAYIDDIAARLAPDDPQSARACAQCLRHDGRHGSTCAGVGRPATRRRGPRTGHQERTRLVRRGTSQLSGVFDAACGKWSIGPTSDGRKLG